MAIVIHYPHGKDKQGYAYWHHREGKKVLSEYMGSFTVETSNIMDNGFREKPGYEGRHEYATQQEKKEYPDQYNKLERIIDKKLKPGELAGKYENNKIIVNKKIPEKYHQEIIDHELIERHKERQQKEKLASGGHRHDMDHDGVHDHPEYVRNKESGYKGKNRIQEAMRHPDKPGAGAVKRKGLTPDEKIRVVMKEYERGTLRSSSGKVVTSRKQALAIALSESRK